MLSRHRIAKWIADQPSLVDALLMTALAGVAGGLVWSLVGWFGLGLLGMTIQLAAANAEPGKGRPAMQMSAGFHFTGAPGARREELSQHGAREHRHERDARANRRAWIIQAASAIGVAYAVAGWTMLAVHLN